MYISGEKKTIKNRQDALKAAENAERKAMSSAGCGGTTAKILFRPDRICKIRAFESLERRVMHRLFQDLNKRSTKCMNSECPGHYMYKDVVYEQLALLREFGYDVLFTQLNLRLRMIHYM